MSPVGPLPQLTTDLTLPLVQYSAIQLPTAVTVDTHSLDQPS